MANSSYDRRAKTLTARGAAKYGATATLPGGDPTRDVLDYCMNELAGIERYADMIKERLKPLGHSLHGARIDMIHRRLKWLVIDAKRHFANLEQIRNIAIEQGLDLGAQEEL